jgi:hypothetical protein
VNPPLSLQKKITSTGYWVVIVKEREICVSTLILNANGDLSLIFNGL